MRIGVANAAHEISLVRAVQVTIVHPVIVVVLETARSCRIGKLKIFNPPVINRRIPNQIGPA